MRAYYQGFVAEAIDRFVRTPVMDTSGRRHAGLLTGQDMATGVLNYEDPLKLGYGSFEVMKPGPWTQGPVLLQQLALLKGMNLSELDPVGAEFVHLVTETSKLAFADREKYYGDPNFVDVPMARLLSSEYNDERRRLIGSSCSLDFRPGTIEGFDHDVPYSVGDNEGAAALGAGEPTVGSARIGARRHRPYRRHRQVRQHRIGDAERRLAAKLAGHSRSRLCAGNAGADVLAEAGAAGVAAAPQAAAHHALGVLGLSRRRALCQFRHARRRPAGSMEHRVFLRHAHHGMNLQS